MVESAETLYLRLRPFGLGAFAGNVSAARRQLPIAIDDDDVPAWSVTRGLSLINEAGDGTTVRVGTGGVVFPDDRSVTLSFTGTASAGDDFTVADAGGTTLSAPYVLTLPANGNAVTARIAPVNDADTEPLETIRVGAEFDGAEVAATEISLADDETPATGVVLDVSPVAVGEGAGATELAVTAALDGAAHLEAQTVALSASPWTATEPGDYTAGTATLTIPALALSGTATLTLTPQDDDVHEPDETVAIDGTATGNLTVAGAAVTITDDDLPGVSIAPAKASVTEGTDTHVEFILSRTGSTHAALIVALEVEAAAGGWFTGIVPGNSIATAVHFPPGAATVPVRFPVNDDNVHEADGALSAAIGAATTYDIADMAGSASVAIVDDDDAPVVTAAFDRTAVDEGGNLTLTVGIANGTVFDRAQRIVVEVGDSSTATLVEDYVIRTVRAPLSQTASSFEYALPALASSLAVTVESREDTLVEEDETVSLSVAFGADPAADLGTFALTVRNDDRPVWSVTPSPAVIEEAWGSATVTVSTGGAAFEDDRAIALAYAGGATFGTDFTVADSGGTALAQSDGVTLPAGATALTVTVTAVNDGLTDADETIEITAGLQGGDTNATGVLTIADDETMSTAVVLAIAPGAVGEGGGAADLEVTGTLDGGALLAAVEVALSVSAGTATATTDYTSGTGTLTIAAGDRSGTATLTLTPVDDDLDEGDETVTVEGTATETLTVTPAAVTIADNDTAGVTVSASSVSVTEGAAAGATYTVVLDSEPTGPVTVTVGGAGDDLSVSPESLTFTSTTWESEQTVTVSAVDDRIAEPTERVTLTHAVTGYGPVTAAPGVAVEVTDNDRRGVTVSPRRLTVTEGGAQGSYTLVLDTEPAGDVTVTVEGAGDDLSVSPSSLTFTTTDWHQAQAVTVSATDDDVDEPTGAVTLTHTVRGYGTVAAADVTVTIRDDDTARVTVSVPALTVTEGGAQESYTLVLDTEPPGSVTVDVRSAAADLSASPSSLTFTTTDWRQAQAVAVRAVDDPVAEGQEQVRLTHRVRGYGPVTEAREVTVTVDDDDTASTAVELALDHDSVTEDGGAQTIAVTASLDAGARTAPTAVTVSRTGGTAASGTDFAAVPDVTITIPAEATSATETISFSPSDDTVAEGDETVILTASAADLTDGTATLTIADDDTAPTALALTVNPASVPENATATTVTVTATLVGSATLPEATEVTVTVGGGGSTATAGTDHAAVGSFTVTIPATEASATGTFSFSPSDDSVAEGDETVILTASAADLTDGTATLTIADDDTAPTALALTVNPTAVREDASATTVTVIATLDGSVTLVNALDVTVSVGGGTGSTATAGTDHATVSDFTVTIQATEASATGTFTFTPMDDSVVEGDETVAVTGTAGSLTVRWTGRY